MAWFDLISTDVCRAVRRQGFGDLGLLPVPGQEFVETLCGVLGDAGEGGFGGREDLLFMAKTGILAASRLAGEAGFIWLYWVSNLAEAED